MHKDVKQLRGNAQNTKCRALCKSRSCAYKLTLDDWTQQGRSPHSLATTTVTKINGRIRLDQERDTGIPLPVRDIEDLGKEGQRKGYCPYYAQRDPIALQDADLILMPYNFLVDASVRKGLKIEWENSIILVDEAHNVVRVK